MAKKNREVDYIIIGSGAAGSLLANRLSAHADVEVLVLEAGSRDWNPLIRVPVVAGLLYYMKSLNWGYETVPQKGLNGRSIAWPRGRVLGGSTAINGMMAIRGHPNDYDQWAATGLEGWAYEAVLPYFKRFERNVSHPGADEYHGRDGELHTEKARAAHPIYRAWLAAAIEAGYPANEDFNGARQEGVGVYDFNIENGRRVTAASAFLKPAERRPNLEVMTGAVALRLCIDNGRCTGVEVGKGRNVERLRARREVILCAGAVNSPKLLMLSGIGDPGHLASVGIKPLHELGEVGLNLQDHLGIYVQYECREPITLYRLMRADRALAAGAQAIFLGTGPGASVPLEAGGFLRTASHLDIPDVHVTTVPGLSLETTQKGQGQHGFLTNVYQLRPESRGGIRLRSADPTALPLIDPNYLDSESDLACLRRSVQMVREINRRGPMDRFRGAEIAPGEDVSTSAEIDAWIRDSANTIFHPVGTCRMGADTGAVVDSKLRVNGIRDLRIADASVMPTIIGGNTGIPTMMIAEKAAAMLLDS